MALCTTAQCDGYYKFVQKLKNILEFVIFENHLTILGRMMEEGRSMTTFYYYPVNHQSGLQRNTLSKLLYILLIHQNVLQIMSFHLSYMMVSLVKRF